MRVRSHASPEKAWMNKTENRKEQRRTEGTDKNRFVNSRIKKKEKGEKEKNWATHQLLMSVRPNKIRAAAEITIKWGNIEQWGDIEQSYPSHRNSLNSVYNSNVTRCSTKFPFGQSHPILMWLWNNFGGLYLTETHAEWTVCFCIWKKEAV